MYNTNLDAYHVFKPNLTFSFAGVYRVTTASARYNGFQEYRFGNEIQLLAGFSDTYFLGGLPLGPSLLWRYRHTSRDRLNGAWGDNTGGQWINIVPGINLGFSPSFRILISTEIPVWRKLTGVQLTTTYRLSAGASYLF